ncbi:MAG: chlorophyll synthesis pathway protein BchC [Pseudomonadota bacterium]
MHTTAVVLDAPKRLALETLSLSDPGPGDCVVEMLWSGISTGTEKLFYEGRMPPFPGMGYPLVPGYESVGEVVEAGPEAGLRVGERVFVPGATCYGEARGLFGGAAARVVVSGVRLSPVAPDLGAQAVLLALAATAYRAITRAVPEGAAPAPEHLPGLIVGHGVLGRLAARLNLALGGTPTVWETAPERRTGGVCPVLDPAEDIRRTYARICDASGTPDLDALIARLAPRGTLVLAGFYAEPVRFAFPPAFMCEAQIAIAAEWRPADLSAVCALIDTGRLSLDGLLTHTRPAAKAPEAYVQAFTDPACLKMTLDWKNAS